MNIIILSHERSLNKAEGLLRAHSCDKVTLVVDSTPDQEYKPYTKEADRIIVSKGFDVVHITSKIKSCDKIWCVSENLLPVQSQLESYYGIDNLTPFAAEVLSNKQKFDDFCRNIGLEEYVPMSITPTFHKQLDVFGSNEFFTKPDIGTGSNVFYPGSDQNTPNIEYRRWNNKHHFLKHLKDKESHNDFFMLNKQGIHTERFNFKPCRIMAQQYHWSEEPSIAPIGYVKDGNIKVLFYLKMSKVKFGDTLDPSKTPEELHSNSKQSDIAKDLAVWIASVDEIAVDRHLSITHFMNTIVNKLQVKELFFAGPDFHISNNKLIAIDFNPRPGQFMNILDKVNDYTIFQDILKSKDVEIKKQLLWGCSMLQPGKISSVGNLEHITPFLNSHNTELEAGLTIPEFQNLQNKKFNVNFNITGSSEQELFDNYKTANQLLQNCITY